MFDDGWPDGPIVLGVGWLPSDHVVRAAAELAATLERHLVCAFVDPASYLTEWEPERQRTALSLEPAINEETDFPAILLQRHVETLLGKPGEAWSFRVLAGGVAKALSRLAESTGASLLVVGADRTGSLAWADRLLEGSVSGSLTRTQHCPVLIVPDNCQPISKGSTIPKT
jgi:nucleotide-binding universal stress UspA family protein